MTRQEFLSLYPLPEDKGLSVCTRDFLSEYVFARSVYNYLLNLSRPSLYASADYRMGDYIAKVAELWNNTLEKELKVSEQELITEAVEKSKIAKELIKRNIPHEVAVICRPVYVSDDEIHHYDFFVRFTFNVECLVLEWQGNYKRKLLIFVEDGVFVLKYPPYNFKDKTPIGITGMLTGEREVFLA